MLKSYNQFLNERKINEIEDLNEGILGKIGSWIKGKWVTGKIKKALEQYSTTLPEKMKERLAKEFEIALTKKAGGDTTTDEEELKTLKEDEELIKKQLDIAIEEQIKKKPDLKLKAERLRIETKQQLNDKLRDMLKKFSQDDKYKELDVVENKLKAINEKEKELNAKMSNIKNQMETSDKNKIQKGKQYVYTNSKGNEVLVYALDDKQNMKTIATEKDDKGNWILRKKEDVKNADTFEPKKDSIKLDTGKSEGDEGYVKMGDDLKNMLSKASEVQGGKGVEEVV